MSINRTVLSGNLTRDAELKTTRSQTSVLVFSLAFNEPRKNVSTGEWEQVPNFIDCTLFGKRAETLAKRLKKGTKVFIEGKLRWSRWEYNGQVHTRISLVVSDIEFVPKDQNAQSEEHIPEEPNPIIAPVVDTSLYDEDIPF